MTQQLISAQALLDILNAELVKSGLEKADCEFHSVSWHEADPVGGYNWGYRVECHGMPYDVCKAQVESVVRDAMEKYNIRDKINY